MNVKEPKATPLEIEAKLEVPSDRDLQIIAALRRLGPYRLRPIDLARLHSVYLDTPRLKLARHGVALRLRRKNRRWEVTTKWGGQVAGVIHQRPELNVPLDVQPTIPFHVPPGPLRDRLGPLIGRSHLRPVLVTAIQRRALHIFAAGHGTAAQPIAELALDRVELRHPDEKRCRASYREVEIELIHGTRRQLHELVRLLCGRVELTPSAESKFARGMALFYPRLVIGIEREVHGA